MPKAQSVTNLVYEQPLQGGDLLRVHPRVLRQRRGDGQRLRVGSYVNSVRYADFRRTIRGVAIHVALSHLNFERFARGRPPAVIVLGVAFILALLARLAADMSDTYFIHLGWAAAVWLGFVGPKLLRRSG
jgi:hypothetical protein